MDRGGRGRKKGERDERGGDGEEEARECWTMFNSSASKTHV